MDNELHSSGPILHVLVVGFHHKKGCQVEYSYPPLAPGLSCESNECPPAWKYLPTLALPDGSHNYEQDTVYFHLPSLTNAKETIFGISCFRQIDAEKLVNKTSDITRGTVQKSVCVLSRMPLFGHIQVKMALITHAYFKEGDFSQVSLLQETYSNLNNSLTEEMLASTEVFVGLSLRKLVMQFRHKVLLLFKLILLEKRVLFFKSPVWDLCSCLLSVLSLFPNMIEAGLNESACFKPSRPMSPVPQFTPENEDTPEFLTTIDEQKSVLTESNGVLQSSATEEPPKAILNDCDKQPNECNDTDSNIDPLSDINSKVPAINNSEGECEEADNVSSNGSTKGSITTSESFSNISSRVGALKGKLSGALSYWSNRESTSPDGDYGKVTKYVVSPTDPSDELAEERETFLPNINAVIQLKPQDIALPLTIFTKGYLCFPYLSLPYMDLVSDVNVRGYVIGATNVLFKQKRNFADVLVEIDGSRIEMQNPELRRMLHLTTEDLRFADYIVNHVSEEKHDVFLDGVGWEGSDEWIRLQFKLYLYTLLRTSLLEEGSRELDYFGSGFMVAWKATHNYKMWEASNHLSILEVNPGHPFAGQLSMSDMKLRFSHTMQTTEGGRKLNQAVSSTGKAVAQTSRAVGGAFTQAKGALSSWWNTLGVPPADGKVTETEEATEANDETLQQQQQVSENNT